MKREEAESIAQDLLFGRGQLARHFSEYVICGSIRRLKDEVKDIDIVAIEKELGFGEPTLSAKVNLIDLRGKEEAKSSLKPSTRFLDGKAIKRFQYRGVIIDLYLATPATFATLTLIRTGSKEHNVRLTTLAMGKGMKLKAGGEGLVSRANEKIVYQTTEQGILETLLGHYPRPDQRN